MNINELKIEFWIGWKFQFLVIAVKKKGKYWSSNWGSTNWAKEGRPF